MGATVVGVRRTPSIGAPPNEARAAGEFYVVTVEISSNARRATLSLADPIAQVVDAAGRIFSRSTLAERALSNTVGPAIPLTQPVAANSRFTTPIVFDLPRDVRYPKLRITDTPGFARAIEGVLIGDDDSFLHKGTYFSLAPGSTSVANSRQ